MLDGEPIPQDHSIINSYHGTEVQPQYRGIESCEHLWNKEIKVGSFDDLIVKQLENAKNQGRKKVTILDIGSGQANLFKDFLSNMRLGEKTREFLKQNMDFNVEMVGITDAKSTDELLTEQEITENNPSYDNSQITARNIRYTLSFQQRISDVLSSINIDSIDLCLSTVALTYLGPGTFKNTLDDVIDNLHAGGRMVAYDYSGIAPGIIQPDPMFLSLDIRNIPDVKTTSSLKATLEEKSIRFARRGVDIQEEEKELGKAEDLMVKLGVASQEDIDKRRTEMLSDPDFQNDRKMALARRATYITYDEKELITKHILKLRQTKKDILTSLFETNKDRISGEFQEGTINLTKK